jgi:hypothetical protein
MSQSEVPCQAKRVVQPNIFTQAVLENTKSENMKTQSDGFL